jgi:hypothetical protein
LTAGRFGLGCAARFGAGLNWAASDALWVARRLAEEWCLALAGTLGAAPGDTLGAALGETVIVTRGDTLGAVRGAA